MQVGTLSVAFWGPAIFGCALGYIMMNMFVVEQKDSTSLFSDSYRHVLRPTWQGISMFIALALSTTILTAFPQISDSFWSYALGVGAGVIIRELKRMFIS